jgi:hypothetical protein
MIYSHTPCSYTNLVVFFAFDEHFFGFVDLRAGNKRSKDTHEIAFNQRGTGNSCLIIKNTETSSSSAQLTSG